MSLRWRLVLLVLGLVMLLLAGIGAYVGSELDAWADDVVDRELARRIDEITSDLEIEHGELELEHAGDGYYSIDTPKGEHLAGSSGGLELPPKLPVGATTIMDPRGRSWRVLSRLVHPEDLPRLPHSLGELRVTAATPIRVLSETTVRFRRGFLLALAFGAVLGVAGAWLLAHGFLEPIRRLSAEVARIGDDRLSERIGETGLDPDLATLARAFNAVLAKLETAFDRQRQLVSRASHALRTPLAGILSHAEVTLRRPRTDVEYQEALGEIASVARESAQLVDGLLALARAESATSPPHPLERRAVSVGELAEQMQRLFSARAEAHHIGLSWDVKADVRVEADPGRLRELFEALMDNALRYTPDGGQAGFIATKANDRARIEVWNTGPGIDEDERERVFERFYRGRGAEGEDRPGSGLGLALARAIAEAHGARIWTEPRPGGGTSMVLDWPAALTVSQRPLRPELP